MKDKVSKKEFAWYVVAAIIAVFGLTLVILGVIGRYLPGSLDNNFVKNAEKALANAIHADLGFRVWGIIFLSAGVLLGVAALVFNARKADREVERKVRRQQRISSADAAIEVKSAVEIIEEPAAPKAE